ncbi:MAG TPA: hypothetical protein VF171_01140 [Trueperaceae bacterium]
MAKYRKKPVVIEAMKVSEAIHIARTDWDSLPLWLEDAYNNGGIVFERDAISVKTLEGTMRGELDDMLICGVEGEIYPCKPSVFVTTYERVTPREDHEHE